MLALISSAAVETECAFSEALCESDVMCEEVSIRAVEDVDNTLIPPETR